MLMVNIGCGPRFIDGVNWQNFDFSSDYKAVRQCNFLAGIPLPDDVADFAYSSHVLEHFSLVQARRVLGEMKRILKPRGRIRIVVPDLEDVCENYLRSLNLRRTSGITTEHRWATIELLDQLVRQVSGGQMAQVHRDAADSRDQQMRELIIHRTGFDVANIREVETPNFSDRVRRISFKKIWGKLTFIYIDAVTSLLPASLRELVVDKVSPGEKHKWMYDRESLSDLLVECGFAQIKFMTAELSDEPEFLKTNLDLTPDGSAYKRSSIYIEAVK